jgi:hypothetical protein
VLAVGASTAAPSATPAPTDAADGSAPAPAVLSGVLTFEVSQDQALQIISANSGGSKLYLVLLPPVTTPSSTGSGAKAAASK